MSGFVEAACGGPPSDACQLRDAIEPDIVDSIVSMAEILLSAAARAVSDTPETPASWRSPLVATLARLSTVSSNGARLNVLIHSSSAHPSGSQYVSNSR